MSFPGCKFQGQLQTRLTVEEGLTFKGAHFESTRTLIRASSPGGLQVAIFARPLAATVKSAMFDATGACFEEGADFTLEPGSEATFSAGSLAERASSRPIVPWPAAARVKAMDGTRVGHLIFEGLDLSECRFARLHRLDDVLIMLAGSLRRRPGR